MPWTLLIVLFFFLLWLLLLVLFFLKTQQRVSVQVELSAFRGRWRVKKLDVTVDSNCNLLLGSAICVLCGLADKTATQTNTHTHRHRVHTTLHTQPAKFLEEKQGIFWGQYGVYTLSWFTSFKCFSHPMPPARSEISTVMVTRGVWNAHSACVHACAFVSDAVCNSGCCSKTNNSWHGDYWECASVYGNRSQMRLNGNQRGDSHKRIPLI